MAANEIRIIGGKWKRRKLRFAPAPDLRPTLSRVRETLANWLRPDLAGATCIDLFAGSGALGIEALSQGASRVIFVERNRRQADRLRAALDELGVASAEATVHTTTAAAFLQSAHSTHAGGQWDVIFLDPPFASPLLDRSLAALRGHPCLAPQAIVYYECAKQQVPDISGWNELKQGSAGDTRFGLLTPSAEAPATG